MKIKNSLSLLIMLIFFGCYGNSGLEKFYSLAFLQDYKAVRKELRTIGFQKISFKTSDNFALSGLFLARPNATCNVIVCAGWLPGRKEGMATFYDLLPEHCNILLFDARGHGESEGHLLWQLWRYGIDEPKDIIGAITYLSEINNLPIIIAGICSGAFNAAHAIAQLEKDNLIEHYNVKGLIFDSAWGSVAKIATTAPIAGIKKRLALLLSYCYTTKKLAQAGYPYKLSSIIAEYCCKIGNYLYIQALVSRYDTFTNLSHKMHLINSPIFFIHSHGDVYADFQDAKYLSALVSHKECWWIEKSSHAKHHLIHKDTYKEKLTAFIENALKTINESDL